MASIRRCRADEAGAILAIINAAAEAYRGVIPADRWHEPYFGAAALQRERAAGVEFWGYEADGELGGVMGIQPVREVTLIRHAYVLPGLQRRGVGAALLQSLVARSPGRVLVGTWAAARWAIAFYQRNGFTLLPPGEAQAELSRYWTIPPEQARVSVVLARAGDAPAGRAAS